MVDLIEDGSGVHAYFGGVSGVAAFCDGDLCVLEDFRGELALEGNVQAYRWAQHLVKVHPLVGLQNILVH